MRTLQEVAELIILRSKDGTSEEKYKGIISAILAYHLDDVFKAIKNINETSLNQSDRFARILELEKKFGVPKTHIV